MDRIAFDELLGQRGLASRLFMGEPYLNGMQG
jgi:hypothetical protein